MAGLGDYQSRNTSPAKIYYKWKGGEGKLTHWDGDHRNADGTVGAEVEKKLPFKFAILNQTRSISGYAPGKGTATRYYSNQAVGYNDVIQVMAKTGDGPAKEIIKGKYSDIKEKLPQGARLATRLFVYNPDHKQIEAITCQGASLGSFIEYSKKSKIYDNWTQIVKGEEQVNGSVHYFPPAWNTAGAYTEDELKEVLLKEDEKVKNYLKALQGSNPEAVAIEAIDQTPAHYDGEQSQEIVEDTQSSDENPVDFGAIPF